MIENCKKMTNNIFHNKLNKHVKYIQCGKSDQKTLFFILFFTSDYQKPYKKIKFDDIEKPQSEVQINFPCPKFSNWNMKNLN